jgi:hypothetical protein
MAFTDIDNPKLYFQNKLYTGNSGTNAITLDGDENMQPDWIWIKERGGANSHVLTDVVRGITKQIYTNDTQAENTNSDTITAIGSDGFTLGNRADVNNNSDTYVAWNWKAGTSFTNDASSTGIGSIDSEGSVNQTAGFSICKFVGTGANATVKHGLNTAPTWIIFKDTTNTKDWFVYHQSISPANGQKLNQTGNPGADSGYFNNTATTTSVFSVGNGNTTNASSATMITYCFAEKQGYSKFGSYVGNGNADGTFIYTGFRPAWVMIKNTSASNDWFMIDNARDTLAPNNPVGRKSLEANDSAAEVTRTTKDMDFFSNGIKLRTSDGTQNTSGETYLFMAFAESPFVNSNGIPNNGV